MGQKSQDIAHTRDHREEQAGMLVSGKQREEKGVWKDEEILRVPYLGRWVERPRGAPGG